MTLRLSADTPVTIKCLNEAFQGKFTFYSGGRAWLKNNYPNRHFELTREIRIVEPNDQ